MFEAESSKAKAKMRVTLREHVDWDIDFYYHQQFKIYREPYLIWDRETWKVILSTCDVYWIEVDGRCAGDIVLEQRGKETTYIVDFSLLPEYQGKGIGKAALEKVKHMGKKLMAVTRKETLNFFLKSGFVLKKRLRNYYESGVDAYYITLSGQKGKSKG
jgi:ribosomal protein S18 acetylase RimI-like enzyme